MGSARIAGPAVSEACPGIPILTQKDFGEAGALALLLAAQRRSVPLKASHGPEAPIRLGWLYDAGESYRRPLADPVLNSPVSSQLGFSL
jgi:hypothetical protein